MFLNLVNKFRKESFIGKRITTDTIPIAANLHITTKKKL